MTTEKPFSVASRSENQRRVRSFASCSQDVMSRSKAGSGGRPQSTTPVNGSMRVRTCELPLLLFYAMLEIGNSVTSIRAYIGAELV